jgi:hypothetical protein
LQPEAASPQFVNNITNNTIVLQQTIAPPDFQPPVTYNNLHDGDLFDQDIRRIMAIINGVEQELNEKKISKNF